MLIFVTVIGRSAMRILVLGAGGIGGYFGARIHAAGGDVTFLVRPARAAQMRENGLKVTSPSGDLQITPKVLTGDELNTQFDVIMLSCKSYDLESAIEAIAPAVVWLAAHVVVWLAAHLDGRVLLSWRKGSKST